MTDRGTPWWAEEDPAGHQSAGQSAGGRDERGGGSANGHTSGHGTSGGGDRGGADRPGWPDLVRLLDLAVRTATQTARRAGAAGTPPDEAAARAPGAWDDLDADHVHDPADICTVCPVCTLMRTLDGSNPDAVAHLLEAARHATLAVKAVIDAQAGRFGGSDDFEQIRVDE